jgi:hypothetical protein
VLIPIQLYIECFISPVVLFENQFNTTRKKEEKVNCEYFWRIWNTFIFKWFE